MVVIEYEMQTCYSPSEHGHMEDTTGTRIRISKMTHTRNVILHGIFKWLSQHRHLVSMDQEWEAYNMVAMRIGRTRVNEQ